jgi:hypothetical protein
VRRNEVRGCAIGLATFGSGAPHGAAQATRFVENVVDGRGADGAIGALVTTDEQGFGAADVYATLDANAIFHTQRGLDVEQGGGSVAHVTADCNAFDHDGDAVVTASAELLLRRNALGRRAVGVDATAVASGTVDARENFWGCPGGPGTSASCSSVAGSVDASLPLSARPRCVP